MVIGPPRGGFTLLLSILSIISRDKGRNYNFNLYIAKLYIEAAGEILDLSIRKVISNEVGESNLFYNKEFSKLVGGPKWLDKNNDKTLCIRKYLGIKNMGDFTFILYLPEWIINYDDVIHSHTHPTKWSEIFDYKDYLKFGSIRNPIDIIHSSVFSINALASEYIQRELKINEHLIRRELALNKLTNINFVKGLSEFLKRYLDDYITAIDKFKFTMRWEDLLSNPINEIMKIGNCLDLNINENYAKSIWNEIDHRNLTLYHKHSFRKGLLDDWKNNLVNEHLEIMKSLNFNDYLDFFNYERINYLNEKNYNEDQILIKNYIKKNMQYLQNLNSDLIAFAFNKTNYVATKKDNFKSYKRFGNVSIERSSIQNEKIVLKFVEYIGKVTFKINNFLKELEPLTKNNFKGIKQYNNLMDNLLKELKDDITQEQILKIKEEINTKINQISTVLIKEHKKTNIVFHKGKYLIIPQHLGPMDLSKSTLDDIPREITIIDKFEDLPR
tara:strand:+ start:338 stop:1834 length:1497 start_codon:yes stop_codon:yes gene_type:complete